MRGGEGEVVGSLGMGGVDWMLGVEGVEGALGVGEVEGKVGLGEVDLLLRRRELRNAGSRQCANGGAGSRRARQARTMSRCAGVSSWKGEYQFALGPSTSESGLRP